MEYIITEEPSIGSTYVDKRIRGRVVIVCKHHKMASNGLSFCKKAEKGQQKLKGKGPVIGTCYSIHAMEKIPECIDFVKDKKRWAVQHLQSDPDTSKLALQIVKGYFKNIK